MHSSLEANEVASEKFQPILNDYYSERFKHIIERMSHTVPSNRVELIKDELFISNSNVTENQLEALKYVAALHVLVDLSLQGWIFDIKDGELTLKMENDNIDDKKKIKYRLSAERNAQFRVSSVAGFIKKMEEVKTFNGNKLSVKNLIGDKDFLIKQISQDSAVCEPYIQLVTDEYDEHTGYKLSHIWRYFRYTWSIPYKIMPGRNLFYLVRDRLQPFNPIIGIFALGNSVLNLSNRDDDIGWTVEAIKKSMCRMTNEFVCEQTVSGTDGRKIKAKISMPREKEKDHQERINRYADRMYPLLLKNIEDAINEIYIKDLDFINDTKYPQQEQIDELLVTAAEFAEKAINNHNNGLSPDWEEEAQSNLFKRKRAKELAKLLQTRCAFNNADGDTNAQRLMQLLSTEAGRRAINTALVANRKQKIGSNMMEIIVCGAIPPYNELLGGKLISILACSPTVIRDYTNRYKNQVSEIASRMKGSRVVRDSHLVYLGTTSLYAVGSSQYNRIRVPQLNNSFLEFNKIGVTEGYGTVFFSKETTSVFSKLLELQDGGKRISHVFGEGTSPRFRMISRGLSSIGIKAEAFLKHYSPRIVYSIKLAKNTNDFLLGLDKEADYGYELEDAATVEQMTQHLINYWYERWLKMRLTSVDIIERLSCFSAEGLLLGNI